ncbi:low density lipoprotein receptor adapter protein 1 isoform X1 [Dryobates pubescens]|uniref:low density lipoprotein receptor adapter protein 1 isoform X1 n=1 Tax=Dryobates pubescens TaxID=118200 RepID=UPI0023B92BD1|nr:low density lipoprotein receptor adapter protein 1 isoform X1 [Dryobates pubescens]
MEALRAAGRAVLRSPRLARHGLGLRRRRKLPESWADMQEPLLEGMCFTLKYLGMTLVEKPKGEDMAAAAIRRIVATARVGARKFQKVILTVSPRGISLQDADTKEMVENISIYRISYCTTDKLQNKVFAYVAQSQESGALECHAFLSPKKKIAQAVTLTVAQAFQMALDLWEAAHTGRRNLSNVSLCLALGQGSPLWNPVLGCVERWLTACLVRHQTGRALSLPWCSLLLHLMPACTVSVWGGCGAVPAVHAELLCTAEL